MTLLLFLFLLATGWVNNLVPRFPQCMLHELLVTEQVQKCETKSNISEDKTIGSLPGQIWSRLVGLVWSSWWRMWVLVVLLLQMTPRPRGSFNLVQLLAAALTLFSCSALAEDRCPAVSGFSCPSTRCPAVAGFSCPSTLCNNEPLLTDLSSKLYLAPTVFEGEVRSMSSPRNGKYQVTFSVLKVMKGSLKVGRFRLSRVRMEFQVKVKKGKRARGSTGDQHRGGTEDQHRGGTGDQHRGSHGRSPAHCGVPAKIKPNKRYIVFAEKSQKLGFLPFSPPSKKRKTTMKKIQKTLCTNCVSRPSLSGLKKTISVEEGVEVKLRCVISGNPSPRLIWSKDGVALNNTKSTQIVPGRRRSLLIVHSASPSDSGLYSCHAWNALGQANANSTVTVNRKNNNLGLVNEEVEAGSTLILPCSLPESTTRVRWFYNGRMIRRNSPFIRRRQTNHGVVSVLRVPRVTASNSGFYACRANSDKGVSLGRSKVTVAPKNVQNIKLFGVIDKTIEEGKNVEFKCRFPKDKKKLKVTWSRDGLVVGLSDRVQVTHKRRKSVLTIKNVASSEAGNYRCEVNDTNANGFKEGLLTVTNNEKVRSVGWSITGAECPIDNYCLNGGICLYYERIGELVCKCAEGYSGRRCQNKSLLKGVTYTGQAASNYCAYYPC